MTAYTKDEREFWEKCCAAPIAYGEGDGSFGSEGDEARYSAELADAKLEEWRKRFRPVNPSCERCKHNLKGGCRRIADNGALCRREDFAWFTEKETDR